MLPATRYEHIMQNLENYFGQKSKYCARSFSRMTGLLFAPPHSEIAAKVIVPKLNYFHVRSERFMDFFCVGYDYSPMDDFKDAVEVGKIEDKQWSYSDTAFNGVRKRFTGDSSWRYSGEVDLLLVSVIWDSDVKKVTISLSDSMLITPDKLIHDKAITSFPRLFEEICHFAETANSELLHNSSLSDFSNSRGRVALGRAALESLLDVLPPICKGVWNNAVHFRTINLNKGKMSIADRALGFLSA